MSIVTMKKLSLLAMKSDKDSIFDALIRTKSVELKRSADIEACTRSDVSLSREKYLAASARAEEYIAYVAEAADNYNALHKGNKSQKIDLPKGSLARPLAEIDFEDKANWQRYALFGKPDYKTVTAEQLSATAEACKLMQEVYKPNVLSPSYVYVWVKTA